MLDAYKTLTISGCASTPGIKAFKEVCQDATDMVPGGRIAYFLVEKLQGTQLGPSFWNLSCGERDAVRVALKNAWK